MNLRVPRGGALGVVLAVVVAVALFVYLMGRFGGPTLRFGSAYRLIAPLSDTKQLAVRSDVDVRGVKVGQVEQIATRPDSADVTFSVESRYAPIYRDATVRVGEKTLLGESYIDLDPGHPAAGRLASGSHLAARNVLPASIEIDQALNALTPSARMHLKSTLETIATGASGASAPAQVGDTLGQLQQATSALRRLTDVLHGQEADIAGGVRAAQVVLAQLGQRQGQVRMIVSAGRATLGALAARDQALRAGVAAFPPLLSTARMTLQHVQPLLRHARPLLAALRSAAPPLTSALTALPPVTRAANPVIAGLRSFNAAAVPVLGLAGDVLADATPVSTSLPPALRNLVTVVRFLSDHRREIAAWFANTADLGSNRDAKGFFARFFIFVEPGTSFGYPSSVSSNPYTQPGDAVQNKPYSGYPRLMPYTPPPR